MSIKKILPFLFVFAIIFASCSSDPDCSSQDTSYKKYGYDENLEQCVVVESIQQDVCGNGVQEDGETYCNCPKDVGQDHPDLGCFGSTGEYLENVCQEEKCVLSKNDKVVEQTKKLEFRNTDLTFEGLISLDTPYILGSYEPSEIVIDMTLFSTSNSYNIKDIRVDAISIEDTSSTLLASSQYNEPVSMLDPKLERKVLTLSETTEYEMQQQLRVNLIVSYTKEYLNSQGQVTKTEQKKETLTSSLGRWEIINPNFFE